MRTSRWRITDMGSWRFMAAGLGLGMPFAGLAVVTGAHIDPVVYIERMRDAPAVLGPCGFALIMAAQTLIAASGILPASLVGVAAGLICGPAAGFLVASLCTMGGAFATFTAVRRCSKDVLRRRFRDQRRLWTFDAMLARDGWRFVCLLRLSPVMPFAATSSLLGLSSIGLTDYMIGTAASLPALLGYVMMGAFLQHLGSVWQGGFARLPVVLLGLGMAATVALTIRVGQLAARALASAEAENDALAVEC